MHRGALLPFFVYGRGCDGRIALVGCGCGCGCFGVWSVLDVRSSGGSLNGWHLCFVGVVGRVLDFVEEVMMRRAWVLCLLLMLPVADAWADYPVVMAWVFGPQPANAKYFDTDPPTACSKYAASLGTGWTCKNVTPNGSAWQGLIYTPTNSYSSTVQAVWRGVCPYGGTISGSMCVGADPPPQNCPIGQKTEDWYPYNGNGTGFPICASSGCAATATNVHTCITMGSTGVRWCDIEGTTTGAKCNAQTDNSQNTSYGAGGAKPSGSSTPSDLPPTKSGGKNVPCPAGSVQGGFDSDGIAICIGTGSDPKNPPAPPPVTTKPPVTVNNSDGSTTTTQQTTQQNSDGSTTTTTTTTVVGVDGSKTVTVGTQTSNTSTGTVGRQDTPDTDQMNLCKQNPNLSICRNSSVSGDCTSGVVCSGDAIQCATLQAAQKLQCARQADEDGLKTSASKTLGDAILGGTDPSKGAIDTVIKGDTADLSAPNLDQGGFVGGGSCLPDKTFSVMGHVVTMSFATVCSNIQPVRYIVMACAFVLVYLMVARSVING